MSSPLKDTWVSTVSGSYKAVTPAQSLMVSNSSPRCWCHFTPWPEMCEVVIYIFANSYFCPLINFRHSKGSIVVSRCSLKHDSLLLSTFYRCILSFRRFFCCDVSVQMLCLLFWGTGVLLNCRVVHTLCIQIPCQVRLLWVISFSGSPFHSLDNGFEK